MGSKVNTASQVALDNARIAGTKKHWAGQASILVGGTSYTVTQVVAIYQADLEAKKNVAEAAVALKSARMKARQTTQGRAKFDALFVKLVQAAYGGAVGTLADFGLKVTKPKKPTALVRAKGVVKAKATKALRFPKRTKR